MYARADPRTREVPIVFVTGLHETEEATLRGYGSGAVDLLYKPYNPEILLAKIKVFLDLYLSRRRLSDEIRGHKRTLADLEAFNYSISQDPNPVVMIERVARLLVPALADWCVIELDDVPAGHAP
jgi:two-component system, sensor histidine kinase and response regulator